MMILLSLLANLKPQARAQYYAAIFGLALLSGKSQ